MKKRNLKSLSLNKKAISNFQAKGGRPPASSYCIPASLLCDVSKPQSGETYFGGVCSYCEG